MKKNNHYTAMKFLLWHDILNANKPFTWRRIFLRCWRDPSKRFLLWWRIASYLHSSGNKKKKRLAQKINWMLIRKYNTEIMLGAEIGGGLQIRHFNGLVITSHVIIGQNFRARQNTTIGVKGKNNGIIRIGNHVEIGANSCIIGDNLEIGDNVMIGAMSFINKDIPSNCIVYTEKKNTIKIVNQ